MRVAAIFLVALLLISAGACSRPQQDNYIASNDEVKDAQKSVQEPNATEEPSNSEQQASMIPEDIEKLLDKSKTRVRSLYYKFRGPLTGSNYYEFYVKGDKIMYKPWREIKSLDQFGSYDSVFIDKDSQSAQAYCTEAYCKYKGKKVDLAYEEYYLFTPIDWIEGTREAAKLGDEVINDRNTWKIQTNKGILWIDTFYGIPLKVESGGVIYKYEQIGANGVTDEEVTPPS